ncbi:FAD-binding and (Fe-S)-binding domain-containing protein [Desulfospira joergensenii]|uniref:FAD-binding and (Fe-S)-binding domain-containing protein n=1 Tax=Desulfospira joergensenii TaxID=53329 RepID=UPI0003B43A40|nr:FAD-binding and (Fe-S)-binding domain-containing protein [Desulfospira joergensenii]
MPSKKVYRDFYHAVLQEIPKKQLITDLFLRSVIGTDAGFYCLVPEMVIDVENERQVRVVLREAGKRNLAITFRAAGTSLSGQSISDSILVRLGPEWNGYSIFDQARFIRLQPGIIGGWANRYLLPFNKKIGPDPASIDTAKIGGILANNASGMCCGVAQNSYQTLESIRLILADATRVDTGDTGSVAKFRRSHAALLDRLAGLRQRVLEDEALAARIRHKFKIKNTTGYSLNALVDYEDPVDIMAHLMIGSEGTLAFIADVVLKTVTEHPHKASALILFENIGDACRAIPVLRNLEVSAAEIMDRASLASVENKEGMPREIRGVGPEVTALLVETRANTPKALAGQIEEITRSLAGFTTLHPISFTSDPKEFKILWAVRKGLFPAVGAVRETGTTVIIEDVAFPTAHLADAALDLQALFKKYQYHEAIIFGHAFEGNLHFVFTQDFSEPIEVNRYKNLMDEVVEMVVSRYGGSLKAEHGTGRNMAPFVEKEWGARAFGLMKEIKEIFDPQNLLNPGVIFNPDPEVHLKNLKSMPPAHEIADKCIECGFCEPVCPSRNLSFSPRQRIAGRREISRQMADEKGWLKARNLARAYLYPGMDTCAADSLCAERCPVSIDTGKMVKELRREAKGALANALAKKTGENFAPVAKTVSMGLNAADRVHALAGTRLMEKGAAGARKLSNKRLPLWNRHMPTGGGKIPRTKEETAPADMVVYFPSCASRMMGGPSRENKEQLPLMEATFSLLKKGGYGVVFPEDLDKLCCGQAFESKGFIDQADTKARELSEALLAVTDQGQLPVLCDTSPCLYRMKKTLDPRLKLFEPIEFVLEYLIDRLEFTQKDTRIAIHPTCSTRKMGLEIKLKELAEKCATQVVWPEDIHCCGFAGDRGFNFPELNESALAGLDEHVCTCEAGYSTSVTCEVGLSLHGKIPYSSILYLVDEVTRPGRDNPV